MNNPFASWFGFMRRIVRRRLGLFAVGVTLLFILAAAFADVVSPHPPHQQNYRAILKGPSEANWMGTDNFGRDVLSRVIHGSRVSLTVGLVSVGLAAGVGTLLGLISGYWSGWIDDLLMRIMDALYSFPAILLALAITAVLGPGLSNVIVAIAVVYTPIFARLVRGQVLTVRELDYVTAAHALGAPASAIIRRHILPNVTAPIIVQASLSVSFAIITEASLSFLGIGVQPPTASWGAMLRTGYSYMELAPWLALFPGAAIFLTVLALNILGDALRDLLDPKLTVTGN